MQDFKSLEFRGIQLDLARQPESLAYIKFFIDFAAAYHYNYLVLYLEGRIRTQSFPYRDPSESYTPDNIREIVAYAAKKDMETIPVVSALGHAEHFLQCPELEHLAELRGDTMGRFSKTKHVFCPTLNETNEFLERYLTEVAELFPSQYFHLGFDEAWDIGYCDLCKQRLNNETQADIFAKQILDIHAIITHKLKKRMIIWDDLFDIYPQALERLPRDLVLCAWHYDKLVELPGGHCGGPKADKFAQYDKLGFDYIFAPWAIYLRNVETLSSYAMSHKPLGALMTVWELATKFLFFCYPTIAYAGTLWSGKGNKSLPAELQADAVRNITGCHGKDEIAAIRNILENKNIELNAKASSYLRDALSNDERAHSFFVEIAGVILARSLITAPNESLAADVLEDLSIHVEIESIYFALREVIPELYIPGISEAERKILRNKAEIVADRLRAVKAKRAAQWEKHRAAVQPRRIEDYFDRVIDMLSATLAESRKTTALLKVSFPNSTAKIRFQVRYKNSPEWISASEGNFSQSPFIGPFTCSIPLCSETVPDAVRIEVCGYVGSAVTFLAIETPQGRFVPSCIGVIEGFVNHPEALLENGRDSAFFGEGEQAARRKFNAPALASAKNVVELHLKLEEKQTI